VTIGVIGQVKAGKSSLVNAILGEQRARTHVLPETREITRYDLQLESAAASLQILDTVGYAHTGPREDQMPASQKAAQESDILLLVLHARTAARQPDLIMLQSLRRWFDLRRDLKMPPVIAVLTHIDFLAPAMEWEPPYAWQNPQRFKEQQIADAVGAVREQLGLFLAAVVPVCVAEGRVYGVQEWLIPTLVELLGEGRAVAMLRCLRAEIDAEKIRKVFKQLFAAGKEIATVLMKSR
jgi:predicted GTPase